MFALKTFIAKHSVASFFILTFALSWSGVLLVIGGPGSIPAAEPAQASPLFPLVYLAMLVGPSVAGILLTGLLHGRPGFRELRSRLVAWRASARVYALALLTAPLLVLTVLLGLSRLDPAFLPGILTNDDRAGALLFGLAIGLGAGFFEELGWTGFVVPEMRRRFSVLQTGLIVGTLWGAWHFVAVAWGIGDRTGAVPLALFVALDELLVLPAYRVLMTWVYDRTGSLFVGMLMHASLTCSVVVLGAAAASGTQILIYDVVLTAALWVVVAALGFVSGWRFSSDTPLRRAA